MHPVPVLSRVRGAFLQKNRYPNRLGEKADRLICQVELFYFKHEKQNLTISKPQKNAPPLKKRLYNNF